MYFPNFQAWLKVLDSFAGHYQRHRQAVRSLAALDVIGALAFVAKAHGFCRPKIHANFDGEGGSLRIVGGRHPVISQLKYGDEQYVANDTDLKVGFLLIVFIGLSSFHISFFFFFFFFFFSPA